jgi:hypothetical protein
MYAPLKNELAAIMLNVNPALLLVSATDVAVSVGVAFAPAGAVGGAVYAIERLVVGSAVKVPHAGEQGVPPAVSIQATPKFAKSLVIDAVTVSAGAAMAAKVKLLVIVTTIGGVAMVNVKLSFLVESALEVAAMVGDAFAPAGGAAGGV